MASPAEELRPAHFIDRRIGVLENVKFVIDDPAVGGLLLDAQPVGFPHVHAGRRDPHPLTGAQRDLEKLVQCLLLPFPPKSQRFGFPSYIPPSGISASSPGESHRRPSAAGPASVLPPPIAPGAHNPTTRAGVENVSSLWSEPYSGVARNVWPPAVPAHSHKLRPPRPRTVC